MFIRKHKTLLLISLYSLFYFLIRIILLDQTFMLHDERDIIFSGLSLARTGQDLYGRPFPLSFEGINPDNPLFSIWISAFFWLFIPGQSVFLSRLPFVVVSTALSALFFWLAYITTHDKKFSIVFMIAATFNPWIFHLSRYAMDITTALPIMLLAIIMLLKEKRLLAYALLFFSCFNYQGFRIAIPFVLFACEWYIQNAKRKIEWTKYGMHVIFLVILVISILVIDKKVSMARKDQVIFLNQDKFTSVVDDKRRNTLAPLTISRYFDNKLAENVKYAMEGVVNGINAELFFFQGDRSATNGTGIGGLFFIISLPLLLFGLISLRKVSLSYQFLSSFILFGMTPAIASLNGHTYGIRGSLMIVGFATLMALGYSEIQNMLKTKTTKRLFMLFFGICILLEVSSFGYNYFFRRPLLLGEMYGERERTLVRSLNQLSDKQPVFVFDNEPKNLLMSYLFLNSLPMKTVHEYMKNVVQRVYVADNVVFLDCDINWQDKVRQGKVFLGNRCLKDTEYLSLQDRKLKTLRYTDTPLTAFFILEKNDNPPRILVK